MQSRRRADFRTQGLKQYTKEEALAEAVKKLESERIGRERVEKCFIINWKDSMISKFKGVYLILEKEELLDDLSNYLIYGSEFIYSLAEELDCRETLKTIGKSMIVVCTVPISEIEADWLVDLEQYIKDNDVNDCSIAVSSVAPENIIDILYTEGYVRAPYNKTKYLFG